MRTFRLAVAALTVCAALSACGNQDAGGGTPTPTPTGAQPATSQPTPEPTAPPSTVDPAPTTPPTGPKPGGPSTPPGVGATTLSGTVQGGVEPNCVLLDGYLLLGGPRDVLKPGTRVEVTGRVEPGMMTTCQQGTPFVVSGANRS
ncbi:hypothetical protein [Micromonospora parathelypteridis]|uniref:Uncharacterized protein n=1 Tax=Micromonospora parathelypteridis TaxID=1839617 RepID=A0A840VT11_9ACTN|nr:hypothetical protein [Micromonospora parathelypteridis]MBB5479116.1 hypothetical protein [Micromonospora parathelypteridis]GGO02977.1 hypothetical protein GCM10011576_02840 [Micromonospora parathelypteridis]